MIKSLNYKVLVGSLLSIGLIFTVSNTVNAQQQRNKKPNPLLIYKYTNEKGELVFSDKLPADEKGEFHIMYSRNGRIKEVVASELTQEEIKIKIEEEEIQREKDAAKKAQDMKDKALLDTYGTLDDMMRMQKYELDQIDVTIRNSIDTIASLKDKLYEEKIASSLDPSSERLKQSVESAERELEMAEMTLQNNRKVYLDKEAEFTKDRLRYEKLMDDKNKIKLSTDTDEELDLMNLEEVEIE